MAKPWLLKRQFISAASCKPYLAAFSVRQRPQDIRVFYTSMDRDKPGVAGVHHHENLPSTETFDPSDQLAGGERITCQIGNGCPAESQISFFPMLKTDSREIQPDLVVGRSLLDRKSVA